VAVIDPVKVRVRWNEVLGAFSILNRRVTQNEPTDTDVLIYGWPMDALAVSNQFKLVALLHRGM
jgi:hypothetical protein